MVAESISTIFFHRFVGALRRRRLATRPRFRAAIDWESAGFGVFKGPRWLLESDRTENVIAGFEHCEDSEKPKARARDLSGF